MVYKTDKKPDEPCSITTSLNYFLEEEAEEQNVTNPPRTPPFNLTVVTVEGCPSFIILDWEKTDNDTTGRIKDYYGSSKKKHGLISIGVYPFVSKEYNGNVLWC